MGNKSSRASSSTSSSTAAGPNFYTGRPARPAPARNATQQVQRATSTPTPNRSLPYAPQPRVRVQARANNAHPQPPPQQVTVRCPSCVTTLIAPQGAPRFRCPCGQVLLLQPQRMRCPQCMGILAPPPGLQRFRCPCGAVLSPPRPQVQSTTATSQERLPEGRPTRRDQIDLSSIDKIIVDAAQDNGGAHAADGAAGDSGAISGAVDAREAQRLRMQQGDGSLQKGQGWTRTLGLDNFVHWSRPHTSSGDFEKAWVRSISADHKISWRTAEEGYAVEGMNCPPFFDLQAHQEKAKLPFSKKLSWFRQQIDQFRVPWEAGHKKVIVRRKHLLEDSTQQLMKMHPGNFREIFRFKFDGEPALDAGGVAREWYDQITETLFNLDFGLFTFSGTDRYSYQINQYSDIANEHHLHYFRFAGRLLGKALFDGQLVEAHLVRPMYKHIIGAPIDLEDMKFVDRDTHQSLKWLRDNEDADEVGVTFSVSRVMFGETITTDLKPGGRDIDVTDDNKLEYIDLIIKHLMFESVRPQLEALLRGFYEVVPAYLVSVFDFQELELLLCGLPQIDIQDWKKHMRYRGEYKANHRIVKWFFECVSEFSHAQQAKLLQFATGSSAVPVEGFQALQSHDGKLCWFALQSAKVKNQPFIIAHTCFNRLDIPVYRSKAELKKQLLLVLSMEVSGFGIE